MRTELYYNEQLVFDKTIQQLQQNPELLQEFIEPVFNVEREKVIKHKSLQYFKLFYKEDGSKKQIAPRRYWAQEKILGWNLFDMEDEAYKNSKASTFADYVQYVYENVEHIKVARIVLNLAYCLITAEEVEIKQNSGEWDEWLYDIKIWYTRSFIETPWHGKAKEHFAVPIMKSEIAKYNGLKLSKTSIEKDMKFMIDYVVLSYDYDKLEWLPLFAISIKGLSWYWANEHSNSLYQTKGEVREHVGHKKFTREYNASVVVVVSAPDTLNGALPIYSTMRETLQKFEAEGRIEKCLVK